MTPTEPEPQGAQSATEQRSWLARLSWTTLSFAVIGLGIAGYILLGMLRQAPTSKPAETRARLVETVAVQAETGAVPVRGSGFVEARREVALAARVGGSITAVSDRLEAGLTVSEGEMLVQLDPRPFEAALEQARADAEATRAEIRFLNQQIERVATLNQGGFASEERRDDLASQRAQATARLARLEAQVRARELDLEFTTISAPFDGRILSEAAAEGAVVQIGAELARLYATDVLEVVIALEASRAGLVPDLWTVAGLEPSDRASATLTVDYGGQRFAWTGSVARVEADIDRGTRTVDVVVAVPDPDRPGQRILGRAAPGLGDAPFLRPGMFAEVVIAGQTLEDRFSIPPGALRADDTVWVVSADNTLEIIGVQVVDEGSETVSVVSGDLDAGDRAIISALPFAVEGMPVREAPQSDEAAAEDPLS